MRCLLLLFLAAAGCTYAPRIARSSAVGDLDCPQDRIYVASLGGGAYRAIGCGRSETYICSPNAGGDMVVGRRSDIGLRDVCKRQSDLWETPSRAAFNREAASAAARMAAAFAGDCKDLDGPRGEGVAHLTFDPSGRVSNVRVDAPHDGTVVGECVKRRFERISIPPFDDEPVHARKEFRLD
jgi:hypothetical protein